MKLLVANPFSSVMCGQLMLLFLIPLSLNLKGGVLFKGNLRGKAAKSFEKITKRMQVGLFFFYGLSLSCTQALANIELIRIIWTG